MNRFRFLLGGPWTTGRTVRWLGVLLAGTLVLAWSARGIGFSIAELVQRDAKERKGLQP